MASAPVLPFGTNLVSTLIPADDRSRAGGTGAGQRVPVAALLDDGYAAMGWDADGVPTAETLARVGIAGDVH